ncbi:MAG: hypothetical protein WA160_08915 [Pseudobdellovibrio sp.]
MSKFSLIIIFFSILFKLSIAECPNTKEHWIVWNIGQGQWVSHILTDECIHYDVGGEFKSFAFIKNNLIKECGKKRNLLLLSHWDFDHYMNISELTKTISNICWYSKPALTKINKSIKVVLDLNIRNCDELSFLKITQWSTLSGRSTNDLSIVNLDNGFLIPGDSPVAKEKIWIHELKKARYTRVLILGHHGSRTSTGTELLSQLPNLKMAIASAREKKFGHPHKETLERLRNATVPVLKTEDWGSIWFL